MMIGLLGRERIPIEWSDRLVVHNVFRFFELVFGRKPGIRMEAASYIENGRTYYRFYTVEAILAHAEGVLRNMFKIEWATVRVYQLQFAGAVNTPELQIPWISFAIGFDNVSTISAATSTSPATWTHTVSGAQVLIAVGSSVSGSTNQATTAVTYNAVSATKARNDGGSGSVSGTVDTSVWLLGGASTGANLVSVTFGASGTMFAGAVSYSGAQSSSVADAVGGANGTSAAAQSFTVTTVANNCWVFATGGVRGGTTPNLNSSLQNQQWTGALTSANSQAGQDFGPKTPAGAVTMGWTTGTTGSTSYCWAMTGASFAPNSVTLGVNSMLRMFQ